MTAGNRNRRITIERAVVVTDDYGGESSTWANHTEAWAEVLFGTGAERREAAQESGSAPATFIVLWTPTLAALKLTDRIQAFGTAWDIQSIAPVGLHKEIHITATRSI